MTLPEHLDPETTAPDLPDGYDPDGGWEPWEWLDEQDDDSRYQLAIKAYRLGAHDYKHGLFIGDPDDQETAMTPADYVDEQRPADFDDEERRP